MGWCQIFKYCYISQSPDPSVFGSQFIFLIHFIPIHCSLFSYLSRVCSYWWCCCLHTSEKEEKVKMRFNSLCILTPRHGFFCYVMASPLLLFHLVPPLTLWLNCAIIYYHISFLLPSFLFYLLVAKALCM